MFKKWSLVLTFVLAVSMLVSACSGNNNGNNTPAPTSTSTSQPAGEATPAPAETPEPTEEGGIGFIKASDPSKNPQVATNRTDTLIVGMADPQGLFSPLFSETVYDRYVTDIVFDSLIEYALDASYENSLAESVTVSDDGLTYTYKIKPGVTFSDGKPLTAKDYLFTMKILHDPAYDGNDDTVNAAYILGGKEYYEGKSDTISGINIISDTEFSVTVSEYNALTPVYLGGAGIIPEHYYGVGYSHGNLDSIKGLLDKPLGSGPYILADYKPGQEVVFTANANYFKGAPKIPNVIYKTTTSVTDIAMLQSGETDMNDFAISADNVETLVELGYIDVNVHLNNGYGYVGFNMDNPKFSDKRVRQALTYGLNRADIVEGIYGPYAEVINIPQSNLSWAYTNEGINQYEFDLDKAKALLDEAGWVVGADGIREKDGIKFEIDFSATANNVVVDALIPIMTLNYQELGIKVVAETLEFNAIMEKKTARDYEMFFAAWGLTADPDTSIFITDGPQNEFGYSNPRVDELMAAGKKEIDIEKRKPIYHEMYQHINDDAPFIFLYQRTNGTASNARVDNLIYSPYKYFSANLYQTTLQQ
jgi:peptide/nickel transport system substrate-binding protein